MHSAFLLVLLRTAYTVVWSFQCYKGNTHYYIKYTSGLNMGVWIYLATSSVRNRQLFATALSTSRRSLNLKGARLGQGGGGWRGNPDGDNRWWLLSLFPPRNKCVATKRQWESSMKLWTWKTTAEITRNIVVKSKRPPAFNMSSKEWKNEKKQAIKT